MDDFFKQQLKGDRVIWSVYVLLLFISLVEGYSSQSFFVSRASSIVGPFLQHVLHLAIGFVALVFVLSVNYRRMRMLGGYFLWIIAVCLLIYASIRSSSVNGASRWVFGLQPSELAKLSLIILTADWIARAKRSGNEDFEQRNFKWFAAAVFVTCGLIFTENLSTAGLLFIVVTIMLFCGGISFKRVFALWGLALAGVALVFFLAFLVPQDHFLDDNGRTRSDLNVIEKAYYSPFKRVYTWMARFERFEGDNNQAEKQMITDENRQVLYGKIAIARGGFFPHMPGSSEVRNKLPQAYSDFVFTIVVEELGSIIGGVGIIALYLILLFRAGRVVSKSTKVYPAVLAIGVSLIIVLQALVHVAVCVQLIPVTGQPLPLITRGGTSILITSVYFGLLLNVTRYAYANHEVKADLLPTSDMESVEIVEKKATED